MREEFPILRKHEANPKPPPRRRNAAGLPRGAHNDWPSRIVFGARTAPTDGFNGAQYSGRSANGYTPRPATSPAAGGWNGGSSRPATVNRSASGGSCMMTRRT
jgi:hypothetical protein